MKKSTIITILLSIFIYSISGKLIELDDDNFIAIRTNIDQKSVDKIITKLFSSTDDIYLYITSNGGDVLAGTNLIDIIQSISKNNIRNITCIADNAASMAFAIFQSCPVRYVRKNSILMQHQMSLTISGSLYNILNHIEFINSIEQQLISLQAKRLGLTDEEFIKITEHDYWLYGKDIIDHNAADEIVDVICSEELVNQSETITVPLYYNTKDIVVSKCPLISSSINDSDDS